MRTFHLHQEQWLPRPRAEVFAFFAEAQNLQAITPEWLDFRILTPGPIPMGVGTLIDYRIRLRGIPMRWRTRIAAWQPPDRFVDVQLRGPYRKWEHTHRFIEERGGTRCLDDVEYSVLGGVLVDRLFVRRDVEAIFRFRHQALERRFGSPSG